MPQQTTKEYDDALNELREGTDEVVVRAFISEDLFGKTDYVGNIKWCGDFRIYDGNLYRLRLKIVEGNWTEFPKVKYTLVDPSEIDSVVKALKHLKEKTLEEKEDD